MVCMLFLKECMRLDIKHSKNFREDSMSHHKQYIHYFMGNLRNYSDIVLEL